MVRAPGVSTPVLVTGMPRSGTTWLARLLASGSSTALTGREPMNPRGRQYALAGTLPGWVRLEAPTPRQRRALQMSYRGLNPLVYSRFGYRQWAAPLPGVTVVIKDPFAMLSLPAVHQVTSAIPVLLFRHPGAALTSYRRMGWSPDLRELAPIVDTFLRQHGQCAGVTPLPADAESDEIVAMAWFWKALYGMALYDAERLEQCVVVAHHDVAEGGEMFCRALFDELGLRWSHRVDDQLTRQDSVKPVVDQATLHNFDRPPTQVAREWESKVIPEERARIEHETADVLSLLADRAFRPAVA